MVAFLCLSDASKITRRQTAGGRVVKQLTKYDQLSEFEVASETI